MATAARYPKTVYGNRGKRNTANYSGIEGNSTNTRYSYAKPTEKQQHGLAANCGTDIQAYELPLTDVDVDRRNFPGYTESIPYSLDDIRMGDTSGTTETDSDTDSAGSAGYTRINSRAKAPTPGTRR